jgi:hypothetical protein
MSHCVQHDKANSNQPQIFVLTITRIQGFQMHVILPAKPTTPLTDLVLKCAGLLRH